MINDEHTRRRSAGAQPSVLTHPLHTGPLVSIDSAMAPADAGLANVLEPATARVTAIDRARHSDGCAQG
jgi:hypothetical protein